MKYAISQQGLEAMLELGNNLRKNQNDIKEARDDLKKKISDLGPSVGEFEEPLNDLISDLAASLQKEEDIIEEFAQKAYVLASEIEKLLNSGL